ncbi:putative HTH-type transcriptional regulator YbaQ [Sedimentisphaera cyanobacteriorum]|uniref:Putative HTH-type transcriptional regulator YbaQ n=1 Tax=Sedimentisphaera cyanobacteriorum TaxID=1940790 RepID=A0A1Q2HND6_9BACT|nr:HigA family addiction module antitoxin [Sedimentisphaera cyanobacteriorum]AQQ09059.1 putative HTH-type transcriptional regulator YbaQ [Sedimentisphaera cyanobacteriorum]
MKLSDLPAIPFHPGRILQEEFLTPLGITQTQLAKHIIAALRRVNEICRGRRSVSPQTASLLSQAFGATAQFWLNGQITYDLAAQKQKNRIYDVGPIVKSTG